MANGRGFFRRSKPQVILAAGQRVNLKSTSAIKAALKQRHPKQEQAIDVYEVVGEVFYGVEFLAGLMSRLPLYAAERPKKSDQLPEPTTNQKVIDVFQRLGPPDQRAELQGDAATNLLVPGEGYLVCFGEREAEHGPTGEVTREANPETWVMRSILEVEEKSGKFYVTDIDDDTKKILLEPDKGDTALRMWRRDRFRHSKAASHVMSVLSPAEELLWWDAAAISASKNRLVSSGLVEIPSDMEVASTTDEEAQLTGGARTAKVLFDYAQAQIANPGDSGGAIPIFATYPANEQRKSGFNHNVIDRPQDDFLELRTDRCLLRIAQGLNVPVEIIKGLGTATHWGSGQIEEGVFREHVEPLAILVCASLTEAFLHPILEEMGIDPSDYLIWYDASALIVHPDKAQAADRGVELGAISLAAWRKTRGFDEGDAPTPEERKEILEWLSAVKRGSNPLDPQKEGLIPNDNKPGQPTDPSKAPVPVPPGKSRTPVPQPAAPLRGKGQKQYTSWEEAVLVAQLQTMADMSIRRALEKAGNKLKSRAKGKRNSQYAETIRGIAPEQVAFTLGKAACNVIGTDDLFNGSFDDISNRFYTIVEMSHLANDFTNHAAASKDLVTKLHTRASAALFEPYTDEPYISEDFISESLAHLVPK